MIDWGKGVPAHWYCAERRCTCPKCPDCGHRHQLHHPRHGCRVIIDARHRQHEDNVLCGCVYTITREEDDA